MTLKQLLSQVNFEVHYNYCDRDGEYVASAYLVDEMTQFNYNIDDMIYNAAVLSIGIRHDEIEIYLDLSVDDIGRIVNTGDKFQYLDRNNNIIDRYEY